MSGAGAVTALVLIQWTAGLAGAAAWTQTWSVVTRGHFRVVAWSTLGLAILGYLAARASFEGAEDATLVVIAAAAIAALLYVVAQRLEADAIGAAVGGVAAALGVAALVRAGGLLGDWPQWLAAVELIAGAALLGGVTNGMLLGHWYLNQPGLKPWALARLTTLALVATAAAGVLGLASAARLSDADTEGAVLGLPGFGESFGLVFYIVWLALVVFTGAVVWGARRCIKIRSIQSATGLYYVALLTAGVAEFLVGYLMVNSA